MTDTTQDDAQDDAPDAKIEVEAKQLGWVPKERFRGDPDHWTDAESFVKKGREMMPLLRAHNTRLQAERAQDQAKIARLEALVQDSQESIAALKEFHDADTRRQVERERDRVKTALKRAKTDEDADAEVELTDELQQLNLALREEPKKEKPAEKKPVAREEPSADVAALDAWRAQPGNEWFGADRRKTALAIAIGQELRSDPSNAGLTGDAFLDRVAEEVEATLGAPARKTSKVDASGGGRGGSGGGRTNGKSYADMPADARAQCDKDARKLVGEGKAFKDTASWQKYYTELYFKEE